METRRNFLKGGGAAVVRSVAVRDAAPPQRVLERARALVRSGKLGRIGFCRLGHEELLPELRLVIENIVPSCVIEVDASAQGATLLGDRGTLSVTSRGCRLFPGHG